MIGVDVRVDQSDIGFLDLLRAGLTDLSPLNARIAGTAEEAVKEHVSNLPDHDTAQRLGASPTNHLQKEAMKISATSDDDAATLWIPREGRLRAAFGSYTVLPGSGHKFLTIPAHADAYGIRAGEFADPLFFASIGPRKTPVLARRIDGRGEIDMEVMYILATEATIPEDETLLPFKELPELARRVGLAYVEELTKGRGA